MNGFISNWIVPMFIILGLNLAFLGIDISLWHLHFNSGYFTFFIVFIYMNKIQQQKSKDTFQISYEPVAHHQQLSHISNQFRYIRNSISSKQANNSTHSSLYPKNKPSFGHERKLSLKQPKTFYDIKKRLTQNQLFNDNTEVAVYKQKGKSYQKLINQMKHQKTKGKEMRKQISKLNYISCLKENIPSSISSFIVKNNKSISNIQKLQLKQLPQPKNNQPLTHQFNINDIKTLYKGSKIALKVSSSLQQSFQFYIYKPKILNLKFPTQNIIKEYKQLSTLNKRLKLDRLYMKGKRQSMQKNRKKHKLKSAPVQYNYLNQQSTELSLFVFTNYCNYFKEYIRKDRYLLPRFIEGLKQDRQFSVNAFIRFYVLFARLQGQINQEAKFLSYFFIPSIYQVIELQTFKTLLFLMMHKQNYEQSRKLYESLIKVLIVPFEQEFKQVTYLNREILIYVLCLNEKATHVLISLFFQPK